jgi:D-alanine-D-alanine ligase
MTPPKVAIVYGRVDHSAPADEQDVFVQVNAVREALRALGYSTMDVPVTLDLGIAAAVLKAAAPVVAFNLAETIGGRGSLIHLVPSLLDAVGIPYTGAPCEAILLTSQKLLAKRMLAAAGIATPAWATAAEARASALGAPPWIVKSVWEHASIGMEDSAVARTPKELEAEIARRSVREGIDNLFVEGYVEGREFNLAFLADPRNGAAGVTSLPQCLPPAEIQFVGFPEGKPRMVGYRAKWDEGSFEYRNTPRRFDFPQADQQLLTELVRLGRECWRLFGLRGYARVDFRVDGAGRPWVLEINTNPCLSPDAGFMAAAGTAGLAITDVVRRVLADTRGGAAGAQAEGVPS